MLHRSCYSSTHVCGTFVSLIENSVRVLQIFTLGTLEQVLKFDLNGCFRWLSLGYFGRYVSCFFIHLLSAITVLSINLSLIVVMDKSQSCLDILMTMALWL